MFTELPFLERIEAAARAGFKRSSASFPMWWSLEIARRLAANGMKWVLFNAPPGAQKQPNVAQHRCPAVKRNSMRASRELSIT